MRGALSCTCRDKPQRDCGLEAPEKADVRDDRRLTVTLCIVCVLCAAGSATASSSLSSATGARWRRPSRCWPRRSSREACSCNSLPGYVAAAVKAAQGLQLLQLESSPAAAAQAGGHELSGGGDGSWRDSRPPGAHRRKKERKIYAKIYAKIYGTQSMRTTGRLPATDSGHRAALRGALERIAEAAPLCNISSADLWRVRICGGFGGAWSLAAWLGEGDGVLTLLARRRDLSGGEGFSAGAPVGDCPFPSFPSRACACVVRDSKNVWRVA